MLSRVADAVLWMSRYLERAENTARFIDVTFNLILDLPDLAEEQWYPLVAATGDEAWFTERYGQATRHNVIRFLTFDHDYPNSVASCIHRARENARTIRDTISSEMWEQINSIYFMVRNAPENPDDIDQIQDFYQVLRQSSHLFWGIADATMSRGEGWHFMRLGQMLERADKTSRILDVKYFLIQRIGSVEDTTVDDLQWSAVLRSVSAFEMFQRRHHGIRPDRVVGFLVLDRLFPRSIMFCLNEADASLHAISGSPQGTFWNPAEKALGQLRSELAYMQVADIMARGVHQFLDHLQRQLNRVGDAIFQTFVAMDPEHPPTAQPRPRPRTFG